MNRLRKQGGIEIYSLWKQLQVKVVYFMASCCFTLPRKTSGLNISCFRTPIQNYHDGARLSYICIFYREYIIFSWLTSFYLWSEIVCFILFHFKSLFILTSILTWCLGDLVSDEYGIKRQHCGNLLRGRINL